MTDPLLSRDDIRHCLAVAEASQSNLWLVGRLLKPQRRAFFAASYASMRVIDDFVDDDFLQRSDEARQAGRTEAAGVVDAWEAASGKAAHGDVLPDSGFDDRLFTGLAATLGCSDLGDRPWRRMAQAMRHDVNEERFVTWGDFETYCEGATVAPASVFLYVLAMRGDADAGFVSGLPGAANDPADLARDMGVFCYLVHILRDLRKDAERGETLLTIPDDILSPHGLDRKGLAGQARSGQTDGLVGLVQDLAGRATAYREGAVRTRATLDACLGKPEAAILDGLLSVYYGLHDRVLKDPAGVICKPEGFGDGLRRKILAASGLSV
ncbi:MAG: squalene/phytoene synthase family protein [Alphaproteobacteria bacterium]